MRMKIKQPNGIVYFLIYLLIYPVLKIFFRLKVDRSGYQPPKGPFIVISNHQSFMDFLLTMLSIYPRRLHPVTAKKFFLYRPLHKLLPFMGCIPKNLFDPDPGAIRGIMTVLKRGGRILLYPEGRCTVGGGYMGMHKSTGKLVKKLGVPVMSCRIDGSYMLMPFWHRRPRLGRVQVTLSTVFHAEELQDLSIEEINRRMDESLGSATDGRGKGLSVYSLKHLTEGLEGILYYCPHCRQEFTIKTKGSSVFCTACGSTAKMDRFSRLVRVDGGQLPESIHAWYKEQAKYEMQFLHEDMEPIEIQVTVRMPLREGEGVEACGEGLLSLYPQGWEYRGRLLGKEERLFFLIDTVPASPFDPDDNFQIYAGGKFYLFTPENVRACVKYATIAECAYWRFASPIQMTAGYDSGFIPAE